jgi:hypothetical protein
MAITSASTPKNTTPGLPPTVRPGLIRPGEATKRRTSANEIAAAITTAASAVCGQIGEERLKNRAGARRARRPAVGFAACRVAVQEPLEDTAKPEHRRQFAVEADHLLVRVDLVAAAGARWSVAMVRQ